MLVQQVQLVQQVELVRMVAQRVQLVHRMVQRMLQWLERMVVHMVGVGGFGWLPSDGVHLGAPAKPEVGWVPITKVANQFASLYD